MKHDSSMFFNRLYPQGYYPYTLKNFDIWAAIILFIISLLMYFRTLNPSVTAGDSGELITTVYNMGASHPPGFPLYGIIGKLFTFLKFSDIGYKMNIFSAVSAAGAVLFAYLSMVKLLGFNRNISKFDMSVHIPAIAGTLVFAFSKAHWSQAVMAEVYALNAILCSALFYVMILWYEEIMAYRNEEKLWLAPRLTLLLAFIMGLSLTDHQIPVWYMVAWVIMLIPVISILISFKGRAFEEQFKQRLTPLMCLGIVICIALILLAISAIKPYILFPKIEYGAYRLVYPEHVPYILTAILIIPIWLTFYTVQNKLLRFYQSSSRFSLLTFLQVLFWICFTVVCIIWLYYLGIFHGTLILMPLVFIVCYQSIQKKTYFTQDNWIENFLFLLTVAMWLMVFALSIYLYMWIRAKAIAPLTEPKPLSWGDTQTIDILINHMLRKQYPVGIDDYSNVLGQLQALIKYHISQFGVVNVIVGIFGIFYFFKREPVQAMYFTLASFIYFFTIIDFINFEVTPRSMETQEVFFIQQFLIYVFYIVFGYQLLMDIPMLITNKKRG